MPPTCLLDAVRSTYPHLGVALYAYEPGLGATLELHSAGQTFTYRGATVGLAIRAAFPEMFAPPSAPPVDAAPEPPPAPAPDIFD